VPVVFMSAQDGYNVRNSIEEIDRVAEHQRRVLPTGVLNRTLAAAMTRTQMPSKNGRQMRFHYATQTGANPMILRLFVNDARLATKPFQDFLIRNIREAFDLEGAAIILQFRSRVKSAGKGGSASGTEEADAEPDENTLPDGSPRRPIQKPRRAGAGKRPARKGPPSLGRGKNNLTPKSRRPRR
jgi:hypothetical protein